MSDLKCAGYAIVFEEVPDEVSLAINISGCPHHCEGCHSPYLAEDIGNPLLPELISLLNTYQQYITCVCFMGGDQNIRELRSAFQVVKALGLKVAHYSGADDPQPYTTALLNGEIDYLKIGHYDKEKGPLNSPTTNQRFYDFRSGKGEDITWRFQWKEVDSHVPS